MREKVKDKGRLEHILEAIDNIFEFTAGVSFEQYTNNKMLRFAVIKNLENVGEASYFLTKEFREEHPQVEWRVITDMRHVLVHGYSNIDDAIVWEVIKRELEPLRQNIIEFIAGL